MQKFALAVLIVLMLGCLFWFLNPSAAGRFEASFKRVCADIWYEKEILIAGDTNLSDKTIRDLLPTERSNLWWWMNMDLIEASLKKSPWIAKAIIHPCATSILELWGCFVVSIEERKPSFLLNEGDVIWLVGQDGGFISPLTPRLKDLFQKRTLKLLRGFYDDNPSTDLFNARFHYVREAIEIIEKRTRKRVSSVELLPGGEIEVSFENCPYQVVFSGGSESAEPLHFELDRLEALLDQLADREDSIEKIDLAFNKLAVVKIKEEVAKELQKAAATPVPSTAPDQARKK